MQLRNGAHGYGVVTRFLHWLTVAAILGQFVVGYTMDFDEASDRAKDRFKDEASRLEEDAEGGERLPRSRSRPRSKRARTRSTPGRTTRRPRCSPTSSPGTRTATGCPFPSCT
jgi:hypothetical protein